MRYMNQILCFKRMIKPLALAAVLFYSSCSDLLENDNAFFHVSTQEQQWNSLTDTRSALFGIYGLMRTALGENNGFWAAGDLRLGDFTVYKPSVTTGWMHRMIIFGRFLTGTVFIR